jgi:homoprotocatechuate degradation regulator HpaR
MGDSGPQLKHRNLPLLMLQAREEVMATFRPLLNSHKLTEQQWRVVRLLLDTDGLEPREIGEQCRLSSPSLAGVLTRMDELHLIERERFKKDQRRVRVTLTPRSRKLAARMVPQIEAIYAQLEDTLGKSFLVQLYQSLDQVIGKFKSKKRSQADR